MLWTGAGGKPLTGEKILRVVNFRCRSLHLSREGSGFFFAVWTPARPKTVVAAETYTYDSFGKATASAGALTNPFQYTAREFDSETGLYYYRARYYDQSTGRFLNEDPSGFGGGIDFYAYVGNYSPNAGDPVGLQAQRVPSGSPLTL